MNKNVKAFFVVCLSYPNTPILLMITNIVNIRFGDWFGGGGELKTFLEKRAKIFEVFCLHSAWDLTFHFQYFMRFYLRISFTILMPFILACRKAYFQAINNNPTWQIKLIYHRIQISQAEKKEKRNTTKTLFPLRRDLCVLWICIFPIRF